MDKESHDLDVVSLVAGIIFLVIGVPALFDQFSLSLLQLEWLWPLLLIGLGAGLLVTTTSDRR